MLTSERHEAVPAGARGARVRPGSEGMPREHVSEVQRTRLLSALADVVSERGVGGATVARVVARAGMSRRTFYDLFEDLPACFLAAFEEAVSDAGRRVGGAWESEGRWVDRVRVALLALLAFFDEEPELARLCVVEALAAGPAVLASRAEVLRALARAVDEGRGEARGKEPPAVTAEGLVGAVFSVIHARLLESDPAPLVELLGPLVGMIVLPYLGQAAATRELQRPAPPMPKPEEEERSPREPLDGLDMRLTYRTLRVLAVIASEPGASNREIGTRAGVQDQGQISKLLTRLQSLGLVRNTGEGHAHGAPNAWELTARGAHVRQALHLPGR